MKVIQLFPHSLGRYRLGPTLDGGPYEGGWHVRSARDILRVSTKYEMECWSVESDLNEALVGRKDGITFRIFPSVGKQGREDSPALLKALKEEVSAGEVLVHIHGALFPLTLAICRGLKDVPILIKDHSSWSYLEGFRQALVTADIFKMTGNLALYVLTYLPYKISLHGVSRLFVLNQGRKAFMARFVPPERIEVLPNGIDFEVFRPIDKTAARARVALDPQGKYIMYVGVLVRLKGIDFLLKALPSVLERFPEAQLLIIGDGYWRAYLSDLARKLNVERSVRFLGMKENRHLPDWYCSADAVVMPSLNEAFSVVAIEALACQAPFIGTNCDGLKEIVGNFKGGLLVPPRDVPSLANALVTLLSGEKVPMDREAGRKHYEWNVIARRTLEVYDRLFAEYYG